MCTIIMVVVDEGKLSGNRSQGVEWGRVTEAQPGVCRRGKSREWQSRDEVERRSRARVVEGGYIMYKARREKIPFAGERQPRWRGPHPTSAHKFRPKYGRSGPRIPIPFSILTELTLFWQ